MASEFTNLPNDVIINIFEKVLDAKSLCRCSCVSKTFASLVTKTRSISIELPCTLPSNADLVSVPPVWLAGLLAFLSQFSWLENAILRFSFQNNDQPTDTPLVRWKHDSNGLVIFRAEKCFADDGGVDSTIQVMNRRTVKQLLYRLEKRISFDSYKRIKYIKTLVDILPRIKEVFAFDTAMQGTVFLENEAIRNLKMAPEKRDNTMVIVNRKMWMEPTVVLPLSETVTLYLERDVEVSDGIMTKNCFHECEYSEVTRMMVQKQELLQDESLRLKLRLTV